MRDIGRRLRGKAAIGLAAAAAIAVGGSLAASQAVAEFRKILDEYVESHYAAREALVAD